MSLKLLLRFLVCCGLCLTANAQTLPPKPSSYLNDFAKVFTPEQSKNLEGLLEDFERQTGFELSVVTATSLQGYDISMFSYALAEKWGIGKKEKNNGVLLLFAPNERKINISTGYGVEAVLTDARCKRIISRIAIPEFKKSNYAEGIMKSAKTIIGFLDGTYTPENSPLKKPSDKGSPFSGIIFFLMALLFFFFSSRGRRGRTYSGMGPRSTPWIFPPSSGSFGSGSSGGFGGGSFGGGGASGSW